MFISGDEPDSALDNWFRTTRRLNDLATALDQRAGIARGGIAVRGHRPSAGRRDLHRLAHRPSGAPPNDDRVTTTAKAMLPDWTRGNCEQAGVSERLKACSTARVSRSI
jgi:hypothetical protein